MLNLASFLLCARCQAAIPERQWNLDTLTGCPVCEAPIQVLVFPALQNAPISPRPEQILSQGESSCYYHPQKRAAVPCHRCGRFLCALCDVEFHGEHWCPGCLASGREKHILPTLENRRTHYDAIALSLATLPALLLWPSFFAAPVALYVALRHWRQPASTIPRTRVRYYLTLLLAAAQIGAWAWLIAFLIVRR